MRAVHARASACSPAPGVRIDRRPGEPVTAGEPVFALYTDTPQRLPAAIAALDGGWSIGEPSGDRPLIIDRIVG